MRLLLPVEKRDPAAWWSWLGLGQSSVNNMPVKQSVNAAHYCDTWMSIDYLPNYTSLLSQILLRKSHYFYVLLLCGIGQAKSVLPPSKDGAMAEWRGL